MNGRGQLTVFTCNIGSNVELAARTRVQFILVRREIRSVGVIAARVRPLVQVHYFSGLPPEISVSSWQQISGHGPSGVMDLLGDFLSTPLSHFWLSCSTSTSRGLIRKPWKYEKASRGRLAVRRVRFPFDTWPLTEQNGKAVICRASFSLALLPALEAAVARI